MDNSNENPESVQKDHANGLPSVRSLDITSVMFQILSIGILIGAVVWILRPFLISIVWAGMIVITTWPVLSRLQVKLKNRRGLAVTLMTFALLLIVVVPLLCAVIAIIQKTPDFYTWFKSLSTFAMPPQPEWLAAVPLIGTKLADTWQQVATLGLKGLGTYLAPYAMKAATWLVTQAGTIGMLVIQFLLTVVIAAIFYATGDGVAAGVRGFARRLAGEQGEAVTILAARAVRGVALGVVVTAAIQTAIAGLGLLVTGVPGAMLLTAVIFVLCLAQIGPILLLIPAIIWAYWQRGAFPGTILLAFSILAGTVDNFVRPYLIRKGADMPLVMILAGVIGGLIAFGIIGLFVGPVVLAVAYTLLGAWIGGNTEMDGGKERTDGEPR